MSGLEQFVTVSYAKGKRMKKRVSKPVPLGGNKKKGVPAKNTGGAEKKSWGGWSPPKKVTASKKTAARVQRRGEQARGMR